MIALAIQMLRHDGAKFLTMVLAVALAAFLTQNQASFLVAFLSMTGSQIRDVREADLWVMEPDTECFDQAKPLKETAVQTVRGFPGVEWALPFLKVDTNARTESGKLSVITLIGVPEESRVGEPIMQIGDATEIYQRDSAVIDPGGMSLLYPGQNFRPGMKIRIHDEWLTLRGVSMASPPFTGFPIVHVSHATAMRLNRAETRNTTFVVARLAAGANAAKVTKEIAQSTGWKALTREQFEAASWKFYSDQGVPNLFYITITVGLIVGIAFTGQTFLMFVKENARAFTTLKVLGFTHPQLAVMMFAQASLVVVLGLSIGTAMVVATTELAKTLPFFRGLYLPWEVTLTCCSIIGCVTVMAAGMSFYKVLKLQPADVFRA
ncbi:MAG: ABC transporter permease [Verrucomicrobia bacterium]|nr:MAG: ABC transporter permease [Verrucomicrobiota bacterium]